MKKLGLSPRQRLRSGSDFSRLYAAQHRVADRNLLVFGGRNTLGFTRFGLSVSKKHGNAVRRSRLKRLLREAFRLSQHDLPAGLDLVLIPRGEAPAELSDFRKSLKRAAARLAQSLPAGDGG